MKRGTPEHPKMIDLAEAMLELLEGEGIAIPFDLCHTLACGATERLWHFTARYAPDGDIGKIAPRRIARAVGWTHDAQKLIEIFVKTKWLDRVENETEILFVHDWAQHSDENADRFLSDNKLLYANGMRPRNKPRKKSRAKRGTNAAPTRQKPDSTRQSYPESESYPESYPEVINREKAFVKFWESYPKRNGAKVGKVATKKLFAKLADEDLAPVIAAVTNYAASEGCKGGFAKDPERFLKSGYWRDWLEVSAPTFRDPTPTEDDLKNWNSTDGGQRR